jgi:hypothetical protein
MSMRYAALSLAALCVIFLLVIKNYETWTRSVEITPEKNPARKTDAKVENQPARPQKSAGMTTSDPAAIALKNIFSPDRKDFPVQSSETRRIVRPQIVLYGVTIGEDYQFASIVNPGRPLLRGERETLSLKVGDKVGDYKLAKVLPDRIVMEGAEDSFEVLLHDARKPKKRTEVRTETKPATVTSTVPTAPAPEAPKPTSPAVATPAQVPTTPPVLTPRPLPGTTAPPQTPNPLAPSRRGRMRTYYPGGGTPAAPGTPTRVTPSPQQETDED